MKKRYVILVIASLSSMLAIGYMYKKSNIKAENTDVVINQKNNYNVSSKIKEALKLLSSNQCKKAQIITNVNASTNVVALTFEGTASKETVNEIRNLLSKYGVKATFFVPGIKAAEDASILKMIQKDGHIIGSQTLNGNKHMEELSKKELITDFCSANTILKDITGKDIELLKCNSTIYNDDILKSAYASGNKYVVKSNNYLSYQSFQSYDEAYGYVRNLKKGNIISIKLEGVLDNFEYEKSSNEEKPAIDKRLGIEEKNKKINKQQSITDIVEWILKASREQNKTFVNVTDLLNVEKESDIQEFKNPLEYMMNNSNVPMLINNKFKRTTVKNTSSQNKNKSIEKVEKIVEGINFKELINKNDKKLATINSQVFSTKSSVTYTFRGLRNKESLDSVLNTLKSFNARGTFFVTKDEIVKYPERIDKILSYGNEIGNGGITVGSKLLNETTEELCKEIYEVDLLLKEKGIVTNAYMPGYGYVNSKTQEAISTIKSMPALEKYELFTYSKAPIIKRYKNMEARDIVSTYFDVNSYVSLRKGEIVYFRLDSKLFKKNDEIADIVELLTKNYVKNGYAYKYNEKLNSYDLLQKPLHYSVVTLKEMQSDYESSLGFGRYSLLDYVIPMKKRTQNEALKMMKTNYIGNINADISDANDYEEPYIDPKKNTIDTNGESVIFFAFDDWGGDPVINEILNVLNKHKVKGTFFTISKYVDINSKISNINPNLLRTIALNGHDIASHNYDHEILNVSKEKLDVSLPKSYNTLFSVIGDLNSLKPYFRPPTLLITKEGLESVFESGFEYSVSGNISTHDYKCDSAQKIVDSIENGLVKGEGNTLIMHMSNQAYYTAQALDIILTKNEQGLYGEKYKIAKLSDYLEK